MKSQRRRLALVLLMSGGLVACATSETMPVAATAPYAALAEAPAHLETPLDLEGVDSVSGLYMAGATALREGRAHDAARFFEKAVEIAPEDDKAFLRDETFMAAVMAGDITRPPATPRPRPTRRGISSVGSCWQSTSWRPVRRRPPTPF